MIKKIFFAFLLFATSAFAAAQEAESLMTRDECSDFMTGYYKNPQPEKIPLFLKSIDQFPDPAVIVPVKGWFVQVCKDNPEKAAAWQAVLDGLQDEEVRFYFQALSGHVDTEKIMVADLILGETVTGVRREEPVFKSLLVILPDAFAL